MEESSPDGQQVKSPDAGNDIAEDAAPEPETIDLDTLINRRASSRKRAFQVGLALLLVVVVFTLLRSVVGGQRHTASVAPSLPNGPPLVAIFANVSSGKVTVNGRQLSGGQPFIFRPARSDSITYAAAPFRTETCHVGRESDGALNGPLPSEPCELLGGSDTVVLLNQEQVAVSAYLYFAFGAGALPADLKTSVATWIRQLVVPASGTITIPPGQYYAIGQDATGQILSRIATAPLTESAVLQLPTPQQLSPSLPCQDVFCPPDLLYFSAVSNQPGLPIGDAWTILVPLIFHWQIQAPSGEIITQYTDHTSASLSMALRLDGAGNWQLVQPTSPSALHNAEQQQFAMSVCDDGSTVLSGALQNHQTSAQGIIQTTGFSLGLNGCELQIVHGDTSVAGTVIWRFGVLLAADAQTHVAFPWLPLAPPAEVVAVINNPPTA